MKNYHSILGVLPDATLEEVKAAYIAKAKVMHPDRFDQETKPDEYKRANELMAEINEAYEHFCKDPLIKSIRRKAARTRKQRPQPGKPFSRYPGMEIIINLPGDVALPLVWVPPGSFDMGGKGPDAQPLHRVNITHGFYMGAYPVTQEQWQAVMVERRGFFRGGDRPVETLTWNDCQRFLHELSLHTGKVFRLPTEAEWEYACRAGSKTEFHWGDAMEGDYCWYGGNSEAQTREVGQTLSNNWGLYDMSGNVGEWCQDWYAADYYSHSPENDPQGPEQGNARVYRGGSFDDPDSGCGSGMRYFGEPGECGPIGFRVLAVQAHQL